MLRGIFAKSLDLGYLHGNDPGATHVHVPCVAPIYIYIYTLLFKLHPIVVPGSPTNIYQNIHTK